MGRYRSLHASLDAGHLTGTLYDSIAKQHRGSRQHRDIPTQRTTLVSLLRIHRQPSLWPSATSSFHQMAQGMGHLQHRIHSWLCPLDRRLSYPLYATHFPLIYLYITWVGSDGHPYEGYSQPWVPALLTLVASVLIATLCLLAYDEPLKKWLNKKLHSTSRQ